MGKTKSDRVETKISQVQDFLAVPLSRVGDIDTAWRKRLLWQALMIAVVVHVILGFGAGLWIVLRHFVQPQAAFTSRPAVVLPPQVVDPRMAAAEFDAAAKKPSFDKKLASVRPADFALPDLPQMPFELDAEIDVSDLALGGIGEALAGGAGNGGGSGVGGLFGFRRAKGMEGVFFDLKQDRSGRLQRTDDGSYMAILRGFVGSRFSMRKLERYFRASDSLFAPHIFMPTVPAETAPDSFGVGGKVQARHWVAIYRAKVKAPKSGKFRFVGLCDDILVVRFNDKVVLDGGVYSVTSAPRSRGYVYPGVDPNAWYAEFGYHVGSYFPVEEGEVYAVEILLGEVPGGGFFAHLMIEEQGVDYGRDSSGNPILPVFQVVSAQIPEGPRLPSVDRKSPSIWPLVPGAAFSEE